MCLEIVSVFEQFWTEGAVLVWLVLISELVVMGPMGFGGDEQAVFTVERDLVVSGHKRVT